MRNDRIDVTMAASRRLGCGSSYAPRAQIAGNAKSSSRVVVGTGRSTSGIARRPGSSPPAVHARGFGHMIIQ